MYPRRHSSGLGISDAHIALRRQHRRDWHPSRNPLVQGWPPRWRDEATRGERFRAQITANSRGHAVSTIPFDPDQAWGPKAVPQVSGTVHGCRGRVTIAPGDSGGACTRNPARMRQTGLAAGSAAFVERAPDGPPRAGLAGDSGAARAANRAAGACFGTLAQFYRGPACGTSMRRPAGRTCARRVSPRSSACSRPGSKNGHGRGQVSRSHEGHGGIDQRCRCSPPTLTLGKGLRCPVLIVFKLTLPGWRHSSAYPRGGGQLAPDGGATERDAGCFTAVL